MFSGAATGCLKDLLLLFGFLNRNFARSGFGFFPSLTERLGFFDTSCAVIDVSIFVCVNGEKRFLDEFSECLPSGFLS